VIFSNSFSHEKEPVIPEQGRPAPRSRWRLAQEFKDHARIRKGGRAGEELPCLLQCWGFRYVDELKPFTVQSGLLIVSMQHHNLDIGRTPTRKG
jgi:hypothetical protein